MKRVFIIFDNLTALDFVRIYDPLMRLKELPLRVERCVQSIGKDSFA